ncbi:unnamed protein product, partial [Oikopleura dioica]
TLDEENHALDQRMGEPKKKIEPQSQREEKEPIVD